MRILYTYDIPALSGWGTIVVIMLMSAFFAGAVYLFFSIWADERLGDKLMNGLYVIIFAAALMIIYHYSIGPSGPKEVRYKATVDETYTVREMMDKYEIISIEGEIYTLEDRGRSTLPSLPVEEKAP